MKTPSAYVEAMQTVDITGFVELDDVNPTFFHKPYYMEPQKGGDKANALLREALKKCSKIGIAKAYGGETDGQGAERKYSPGECCGTITGTVGGNPDKARVSTSYVERQILTMRMGMRRFTRLANGFSKKV